MPLNLFNQVGTPWYSWSDLRVISSYLHGRKQLVTTNKTSFDIKLVQITVPEGFSLGPLFFQIHINDLNKAVDYILKLFADNACLVVKTTRPNL